MKNKYLKKWLFDESGKNELFVLMITRLVPLFPYNLQNFAYGVTDIPFGTYSIYSFVFMLPGTAMYTVGTRAWLTGRTGFSISPSRPCWRQLSLAWVCFLRKGMYCGRQRKGWKRMNGKFRIKDSDKCVHCRYMPGKLLFFK